MELYRDGQRELHCVFVDLEKAYDRVPREELWYCMRKSGVAEKFVRVVQDMYERSRTVVRCAVGQTEEFNVEVGLHQGSSLSPFLFAMVLDQLSKEVRQESPWTMMFADDIVICSESREQVEENLERWRFALERRGMKVSRSKTEYMCVNEREGSGTVRLQGEEVKKVQEFKYLGSPVQSNGECAKEVKKEKPKEEEEDSTLLYSSLLYSTLLFSTLLYSILLYSTLLFSTLLYSILLYSTLLCCTLLYSILLYSTLLYSTLLYSTLLYSTLLFSTLLFSSVLYSTLLYSSLLYSALLCSILLLSNILCSILFYSALLYSFLLYSSLLCSTLLYSTLLYSTLLCSNLLYSTLL
ncbi:hypothetical protein QTP70_014065 [Hemibagrus guttatus]|uniref:ribonuclease H n=1 Tax=Hemibagrus guttatus TaxID=175788 RepID=A0AAE0R682_9TELE|nr:hypothetical protein QTP70_014065 [Hemibagrus guttatus]